MFALDLPPKIPLVRPAIIRPAEHKLLRPHYLPATKEQKRAAIRELVESGQLTEEQARRALIFFCVPMFSGAQPGTYSFLTSITDPANATTYSGGVWDGVSIGDADPDRYILAALVGNNGGRTVSSCTIGGVSASLVSDGTDSARLVHGTNVTVELWLAPVPTGTTANISVTWSGAQVRMGAGLWRVLRLKSTQAIDVNSSSSASPASAAVNTAAVGFVVAATFNNSSTSYSWSDVTERYDATVEGIAHSGADASTNGSSVTPTITFSGSPSARALVVASFDLGV